MKESSKGQTAIVLTLAMPILLGAIFLGADSAAVCSQWMELQAAANSAVVLGAAYLPANPAKARSVALQYAEHRGIDAATEVVRNQVSADNRSLTMTVKRSVHYAFGALPGLSHDVVSVQAAAEIRIVGPVTSPTRVSPGTAPQPSSVKAASGMFLSRNGFRTFRTPGFPARMRNG